MNGETATPFPTTGSESGSGLNGGSANDSVHRAAQRLHDTVDTLEQKIGIAGDKVLGLHQEYGDMAREQVRANPLAAVGLAFLAGYIISKVTR